jgi:hypothetical protein
MSSTPGKRVAEIPVQAYVKQRKVSQATIHSPRLKSNEIKSDEMSGRLGSPQETPELAQLMVTDSSVEMQSTTPMETDRVLLESTEHKANDQLEHSCSAQGADLASISNSDNLMAELQDLNVPTNDISNLTESEEESTEEEKKARKEARMMEHS